MSLLERIKAALGRRPNTDPERGDEDAKFIGGTYNAETNETNRAEAQERLREIKRDARAVRGKPLLSETAERVHLSRNRRTPSASEEEADPMRTGTPTGNKGRSGFGTLRQMLKLCEESPYYHEKGSNYISIGIGGPQVRALKPPSTQGPPKTTDGGVERK